MEILPPSGPTPLMDASLLPCLAAFNSSVPAANVLNVSPQTCHTSRVRPTSGYDYHTTRGSLSSAFFALSPITASPVSLSAANFSPKLSRFEPTMTRFVAASNSPPLEQVASVTRLSVVQPRLLDESSVLLSTSVSYPILTASHAPQSAIGLQGTRSSVRRMSQKPRSLSEPSLASRGVGRNNPPGSNGPLTNPMKTSSTSPRPITTFHIPHDSDVDDVEETQNGTEPIAFDLSWGSRQDSNCVKDKIRRFYALRELLTTEFGYLNDLRILVTVYMDSLSKITCRAPHSARLPSSFVAGSSSGSIHDKDGLKSAQRYPFAEEEISVLTRNAGSILRLHEQFLHELEETMIPLGFDVDREQDISPPYDAVLTNLDEAIQAVAQKFLREATNFRIYRDFCASHMEALEVIRAKQRLYPIEWDTFERHCALVILAKTARGGITSVTPSSDGSPEEEAATTSSIKKRKRTSSLTALDGAIRSLRALASRDYVPSQLDIRSALHTARLAFVDYMIKPVQRICKYPLLLAQLQSRGSGRVVDSNVDMALKQSIEAMKKVVAAADEARHQKDMATKSSLIASRMLPSVASGHTLHLSDAFLSSLGTCLLAGSLDMIHYSLRKSRNESTNMKAKYLGAFLYVGGYLILVRVKGKVYEPRHWFCLADFDVRDITEDIALLGSSFCLFSEDHLIELAAACPKEKDIWLSTIRESLTEPSAWTRDQISSLGILSQWEPHLDDLEGGLLTTQSIPLSGLPSQQSSKSVPEFTPVAMSLKPNRSLTLTRRTSSSLSIRSVFAQNGNDDTVVVRRTSGTARHQTDDGLRDVLSRACVDARTHAHVRDVLFQAPQTSELLSRSSSSISIKGLTKTRLSRHETVRIPRRNSLPNGANTVARRELIETRSKIVRARSRKNTLDREMRGPSSFVPGIQIHAPESILPKGDAPASSSCAVLCETRRLVQYRTSSDVSLTPSSYSAPPLRRARTIGNMFRRLSAKSSFHHSAQSVLHSDDPAIDHELPGTCGPNDASKPSPVGDVSHRSRTISRLSASFDNVKRMSIRRFCN